MKELNEILEAILLVSTFFFVICLVMAMYYIGVFVGDMILWVIYWLQQL
jgi:small basic protein